MGQVRILVFLFRYLRQYADGYVTLYQSLRKTTYSALVLQSLYVYGKRYCIFLSVYIFEYNRILYTYSILHEHLHKILYLGLYSRSNDVQTGKFSGCRKVPTPYSRYPAEYQQYQPSGKQLDAEESSRVRMRSGYTIYEGL